MLPRSLLCFVYSPNTFLFPLTPTFFIVMRSTTQASADTLTSIPLTFPSTPTRDPPPSVDTPYATIAVSRDTLNPPDSRPLPSSIGPHSFFHVNDTSNLLSPQSRNYVTHAIQNGWAKSTVKRYSGAIDQYIRFCDDESIPDHLRFPADEFVLCAFAASSAGIHARTTPRNRLSALKAWHLAHNLEWRGSSRLRYVLNGVHNLAPRSSRRPPRPPVNASMLTQLISHLNLASPLDIAVAACATTAFWGQCRLGELLPISSNPIPSTPLPTRSGFKRSLRNPLSCIIRLPCTKTHRHGQDVVLVDQRADINPITLLKRHLRINDIPNDTHLFSYTSTNGFTPLTKSLFLRRCNEIWQILGYPRTSGHCFRIGGTTELLIAGTPPDVVKATGRWSSDSFLRYWRSLDEIAPMYVRHLHSIGKQRRHRRR
jgi:hypothetical protein